MGYSFADTPSNFFMYKPTLNHNICFSFSQCLDATYSCRSRV